MVERKGGRNRTDRRQWQYAIGATRLAVDPEKDPDLAEEITTVKREPEDGLDPLTRAINYAIERTASN